ncbi:bifunctional NAD(P)H-hydrate repair enzyme [Kordiimonas sediminis]|uniref:Bifunctional NAD(P)H-hydrate repair enzyme n=1 Tax=Kordiimonas sediminis TaxID=1735581 RepID=A0A919AWP2_9PROT|nr:NAD(P)H-hydrate dehydratase [Kordiimonas sediminis]GHF28775.1 bifunctional NAD(P)H-hydrate repair enzyme [Kordiimonas sediminis]
MGLDPRLPESHILLSPHQMYAADTWAMQNGTSGITLMERAGKSVAEVATEMMPHNGDGTIIVLCGPGNNGGDGYVAARYLAEWGYTVSVMPISDIMALKGDAAIMARPWIGRTRPMDLNALKSADLVIDAMFGAGLDRDIEGDIAAVIEAVNEGSAVVLAVDLPSGLSGATGQVQGTAIQADTSVTFFSYKPGHILTPGRYYSGGIDNIHVVDIGISRDCLADIQVNTYWNTASLWQGAVFHPGPSSHKYDRGHVLVLGGREPALGASRLASLAALRSGCGLSTLACPSESYSIQATALTDVMVRRYDSSFGLLSIMADKRINTIVAGPGLGVGEKTTETILAVLNERRRTVLDADALTSLARQMVQLSDYSGQDIVLTPHDGEFKKMFPDISLDDRLSAARQAARQTDCVIVLKGVSTIVAAPDGRASIASNAPAWLSVAGAGDVLAGIIAGVLAQGLPLFESVSYAVWLHGKSGEVAGRGLIASDLLPAIAKSLP